MKNVKAPTNIDRWFPNKRYVPMIVSTKKCPLKYHRRLVYSYLVYRLRQDQTATQAKVVKALRLDKTAVASAIGELETLGLVVRERGQYQAAEPNENQRQWFASNGRTDVPWHRQFATYPVLRPKKSSGLSTKTNALLWLLYSLAPKYGKPVVLGQHLAGLAVMLNMSAKGVKQGVDRLEKMGLIERVGSTFLLKQPTAGGPGIMGGSSCSAREGVQVGWRSSSSNLRILGRTIQRRLAKRTTWRPSTSSLTATA